VRVLERREVTQPEPQRDVGGIRAGRLSEHRTRQPAPVADHQLSARCSTSSGSTRSSQQFDRLAWGSAYEDDGLVFARENGTPLRPEYVLRRFYELTAAAGLPRVPLHNLRHLAATLMLGSGVPLAVASKVLRHSQVGITAYLYGHLTREVSHAAVDGLAAVLDAAAERSNEQKMTMRPQCDRSSLCRTF